MDDPWEELARREESSRLMRLRMLTEPASRGDQEGGSNLRLSTMMTASTPATPGPSTPTATRSLPLDQLKIKDDDEDQDIIPPARPSSTPFPQQEQLEDHIQCPRHSNTDLTNSISPLVKSGSQDPTNLDHLNDEIPNEESDSLSPLCSLPIEIHECILDYLFGVRLSASSRTTSADMSHSLRNWNTKLRHCRRREVSDLALVSKKWRGLIQERLYRHIKIKGTRESIDQAVIFFLGKKHLPPYVKHIEIWFPVFEQKNVADRTLRAPSITPNRQTLPSHHEATQVVVYPSPHNNCTMEEVFRFIQLTFGEACVLTLEGGERKKPPMVKQFVHDRKDQSLPQLETITTLVTKGQWNLLRINEDFQTIVNALPNVTEWHGSYAKPKSKSYLCMASIFPYLPDNITYLNIVLESDYRREAVCPTFYRKVGLKLHFCSEMARAMPTLEHFAYTGRVCGSFFDDAAAHSNKRTTRLKTVDLTVKNVCRQKYQWNDGSGITDMDFILAFETLVVSACRSLCNLTKLEYLRIKFIDLDSQVPSLNPYFELKDNRCTGLWSDKIVGKLAKARPSASFVDSSEIPTGADNRSLKDDNNPLISATVGKSRPPSIKVSSYLALSTGITIT